MSSGGQYYLKERGRMLGRYTEEDLQRMRSRNQLSRFHTVSTDRATWDHAVSVLDRLEEDRTMALAIPEPEAPPVPTSEQVAYRPFPVWLLIALHYLTAGVFTFFWITTLHGRLPRTSPDEPTGTRALALMMVPLLNLYWMFQCYPLLSVRLNRIRERQGLLGDVPTLSPVIMCCLFLGTALMMLTGGAVVFTLLMRDSPLDHAVWFFFILPHGLTLVNYLFLVPQFSGMCQAAFNEIAEQQQRQFQAHFAQM